MELGVDLIRKIAKKAIAKEHPAARRDLDKKSREKFVKQFQGDVAEEMLEAWNDLQSDLFAPLDRLDVRPKDFDFKTNASGLVARMTINGGFGLGATSPPDEPPLIGDLGVSIHESVINRMAQRMLAGETITDFQKLAKSSGVKLTPEQIEEIPDDVSIRLAERPPRHRAIRGRRARTDDSRSTVCDWKCNLGRHERESSLSGFCRGGAVDAHFGGAARGVATHRR